jgi:hypothetical protein
MWRAGQDDHTRVVALRDLYPPDVSDLKGELRGLSCYAWEESGFPIEYVHAFNARLNQITVLSRFVAKVLRDNKSMSDPGRRCRHRSNRAMGTPVWRESDTFASSLVSQRFFFARIVVPPAQRRRRSLLPGLGDLPAMTMLCSS